MSLIRIFLGLFLMAAGRKLFWLAVAAIGFVYGMSIAQNFLPQASDVVLIVIGLIIGLIGAALATFLQGIAVWVVGFLAGGYLLFHGITLLGIDTGQYFLLPWFIGGILGAILMGSLFDLALIIFTSLFGGLLVAQQLGLGPELTIVVTGVLFVLGFLMQSSQLHLLRKKR
ncbi:MAG: hypothetical protein GYA17_00095 [Chloroflexi bacterium]|nr:hypothetical protein [Anaerolineaceae bacterium]NMB86724.1 hypothetical protein [Chloroflexota bacterium]